MPTLVLQWKLDSSRYFVIRLMDENELQQISGVQIWLRGHIGFLPPPLGSKIPTLTPPPGQAGLTQPQQPAQQTSHDLFAECLYPSSRQTIAASRSSNASSETVPH
ncbi:uncharacterized protein [Ptychodera flava]|uniref:uncharacterized protein isoform X3 n=1 Tax=Ptychodera flava TaxID=63121 RepID=UPI003969DA3E